MVLCKPWIHHVITLLKKGYWEKCCFFHRNNVIMWLYSWPKDKSLTLFANDQKQHTCVSGYCNYTLHSIKLSNSLWSGRMLSVLRLPRADLCRAEGVACMTKKPLGDLLRKYFPVLRGKRSPRGGSSEGRVQTPDSCWMLGPGLEESQVWWCAIYILTPCFTCYFQQMSRGRAHA